MNKKLIVAIVAVILAILTHGYLTNHYYPLKFGAAPSESLCQLGDKMDCDVAATSTYSNILGVPLSVFGISFHVILLLMILAAWTGIAENRQKTLRISTALSGLSVFASIILAVISATQLTAWCPFCILAYLFSFIIFICLWLSLEEPFSKITTDIGTLFSESRVILIGLLTIPVGAFIAHKAITKSFGGDQLEVIIRSSVNEWNSSSAVDFSNSEPALVKGPSAENAQMTLIEFADFRCGHCGMAAPSVHAFLKSHPDVRFMFYNFPLDGECNDEIGSGDGISCRLAKAVTCAGQNQAEAGFQLHDQIFKDQKMFQTTRKMADVDEMIKAAATSTGVDWNSLVTCMDAPITHEKVKAQAKAGVNANIRGTPTFFVNGKKLDRGQFIPVLKAVYEATKTN